MSIEHITVSIDSGGKVDIALQKRPAGEESPNTLEADTDKEIFSARKRVRK